MAGSGRFKKERDLKNQAMLVVRNITQQEVTNVIFPNGITVGAVTGPFRNGMRVHGNAQVSGIVNAQGFKVNGEDLVASGEPFLFLDIDSPAISFDNDADRTPDPTSVAISITQSGQETTVQASDISAQDVDGGPLTSNITGFSVTETSVGNSFSTATLDLSTGTAQNPAKYPITVSVTNGGRTSTKKIAAAVGGEDGTNGTNGTNGADGYSVILSNPAHTLFTTNAGAVTYTGSGTNISVFKGSSELNGITSGTPSAGEFSVTSVAASGITEGSRNSPGNPIICGEGQNMTQNTASIVYTLNLEDIVTVQAVQSLTKSIEGDDGTSASPPEFVNLTASSTLISYDANGSNPSPSSITLTADSQNFTDGYFKFTGGGAAFTDEGSYTDGTSANQDTATFTPPSSYSATPYTFTVGVADGDQVELASDSISIGSFKPGPDESIRTEHFDLDLAQELGTSKTSANEGHYVAGSSARNAGNPPAIGKLRDDIIIQTDAGTFPASSFLTTVSTGLSATSFCQSFSYKVPTGSTLSLKRVLGFIQFTGVPASDQYAITLHVYRTQDALNGLSGGSTKIEHLAQIDINGSSSAFAVRGSSFGGTTGDPIVVDTGALSGITVSSGFGVIFLLHVSSITTMSTGLTACDGTLSMEYTLS